MRLYNIYDMVRGANYPVFAHDIEEAKGEVLQLAKCAGVNMSHDALKCYQHFKCDSPTPRIINISHNTLYNRA